MSTPTCRTSAHRCILTGVVLVTTVLVLGAVAVTTQASGSSRSRVRQLLGSNPAVVWTRSRAAQWAVGSSSRGPRPVAKNRPESLSTHSWLSGQSSSGSCQEEVARRAIENEYGAVNVELSRRHVGTRFRLARVLEKAREGRPIKVGVLGGSVSAGHGNSHATDKADRHIDAAWWTFVETWTKKQFDQVEFVSGAQPATDSGFFSWCWPEKLNGTGVDLVFLETAVNDQYSAESLELAENLLRSLLESPNAPAVMYVDAFALHSVTEGKQNGDAGMLDGADAHNALASFYDVPQITLRDPVLPALLGDADLQDPLFRGDTRHIAAPLHRYLGNMVTSFLDETACSAQAIMKTTELSSASSWSKRTRDWIGQVPRVKIFNAWDAPSVPRSVPPTCALAGHGLVPSRPSTMWSLYTWRYDKQYLQATEPGARVWFNVTVRRGGRGTVAVSFLRSREFALGRLRCRVGEQETVLPGWWARGTSVSQTMVVATGLQDGTSHELECETEQDEEARSSFRIMSVQSV